MQVVEFINEFQIKTDFGRWKNFQQERVKAVCQVIEWSVSIFNGSYLTKPVKVDSVVLHKTQMEDIGKPFEFAKDNQAITFRKFESVAKWNHQKKCWIIPIEYMREVYSIGQHCKGTHIKIGEQLPEQLDVIPAMPNLDFNYPLQKGDLRDYQKQGVARGLQLKKFINGDMPGLGKSQILTDEIQTPEGPVKMGNIKVGQKIFTKNGEMQKVTGVFPQGIIPTYKVIFNDGTSVNCNLEHIWAVRDANRKRRGTGWINKTLGEIIESGLTLKVNEKRKFSGRKPELKWEIPMCDAVEYSGDKFYIHPYILGIMIGDGYLKGATPQISIPDSQIEIADRLLKYLPDGIKLRKNDYPKCPQYHLTQTGTTSKNPLTKEIQRMGLNILAKDKFIPVEYLQGTIYNRKMILAGLLDSDGSCIKNRTVFHSVSKKLCIDVKTLVESLGGTARIHEYDRRSEGKSIEYQISIRTPFNPFLLTSKMSNWKERNISRYIKSVEYIGDVEQQCISVSSPDKLYLTNNFIVTHNTLQSIATVYYAEKLGEVTFPVLVLCPSALKINWKREFEMWTDKKAMILDDKVKSNWHRFWEMEMADVFIVNYESLRKFFVRKYPKKDELKTAADIEMDSRIDIFKSVIIDEIHKLKNTASQRSKIALRVTRGKNYIIGLTGTPVVNKPVDLVAQLAIISRLKKFGGVDGFKTRYCEGGSGASNLKELNYLLNQNCFFRREKHEVLKDLPAKVRQTITCEITNADEYSKIEKDFKKYLQENDFSMAEVRKKLQSEVIVKITMLLQIAAKGKIEAAQDYIDEVLDSGQKIVVFCKHKIVVDELCKIYPQAVKVTGSENETQKQNSVDMFQKNPKTNIIIGSHKAAGVGLTLTASSEVLFLELPWTFADLEQCEDRCHRMGQPNSVRCTALIGEGTLDNWLYNDVIMTKKQIADAVTGADDIVPVSMLDSVMNAFKK